VLQHSDSHVSAWSVGTHNCLSDYHLIETSRLIAHVEPFGDASLGSIAAYPMAARVGLGAGAAPAGVGPSHSTLPPPLGVMPSSGGFSGPFGN
ncbi:MAG TPA: hypothetical protein PJ982_07745, partial [Lacipirellulaceae bacterium]|nr:hypothetical protein [Lacipirellulaceae bacterium]